MKDSFNELSNKLNYAAKHVDEITDLPKVLTPDFIKAHSKFYTTKDWLSNGGIDFDTITDNYVRQTTDFDSWKNMYETAASEYLQSLFGGIK